MVLLDNGTGVGEGLQVRVAPPDLKGLVEFTWVQTHTADAGEWRVVPDASLHLIAAILDGPSGRSMRMALVGPRSHMTRINHAGRVMSIGVRLTPGAIAAMLPDPAREFLDRSVPLADAFPKRMLERLDLDAGASQEVLTASLLELVRGCARVPDAGAMAASLARAARVRGVAEMMTMAERTLRDRSHREIGMSPKRTLRIMRLHHALWMARPRTFSWAEVAHHSGYADQAHLTRECRSLLGDTPVQWFARGAGCTTSADLFKTDERGAV